jgi:hypothetical protein
VPVESSEFMDAFTALMARVAAAAPKAGNLSAQLIKSAGMKRTHVISGTLRRSWKVTTDDGAGGTYAAFIGPTMIYARRQELGFKGPDSLGRIFHHDPGWPYVRPALVESIPKVKILTDSIYNAAIRG